MACIAQWEINKYTTTLELNGGDGKEQIMVEHGTKVGELPVPTRIGHTFVGNCVLTSIFKFDILHSSAKA